MERKAKKTHELIADVLIERGTYIDDIFDCCRVATEAGFGSARRSTIDKARDLVRERTKRGGRA